MIIGEIRRYLRDNNSIKVSRSIKDTAYKVMQAKEKITARTQKEPTVSEIAKELDIPREDVVVALESIVEPVSLFEPVFQENGDSVYILDQVGDNDGDSNWLCDFKTIHCLADKRCRSTVLCLWLFRITEYCHAVCGYTYGYSQSD